MWHLLCDVADAVARGIVLPAGLLIDGLFINAADSVMLAYANLAFVQGRLAARCRLVTGQKAAKLPCRR